MTFGMAVAGPRFGVVTTDRRLTARKVVVDEDAEKSGILRLPDGRFGYTYSGLAGWGPFRTSEWLAEALLDNTAAGRGIDDVLSGLATQATAKVRGLTCDDHDKRLSILFFGYANSAFGIPLPEFRIVSNHGRIDGSPRTQGPLEFEVSRLSPRDRSVAVIIGSGATHVLGDLPELFRAIEDPTIPAAVASEIATGEIRRVANRIGLVSVGSWCTSTLLPNVQGLAAHVDYFPGQNVADVGLPSYIYGMWDGHGAYALSSGRVTTSFGDHDSGSIRLAPARRNEPCPCGSRVPYRRCHGSRSRPMLAPTGHRAEWKVRYAKAPTTPELFSWRKGNTITVGPDPDSGFTFSLEPGRSRSFAVPLRSW